MQQHYKLVSLNPDKYEKMGLRTALVGYSNYINSLIQSEVLNEKDIIPKSFDEWLKTEI